MNEICATFRPPITIFLMAGALAIPNYKRVLEFTRQCPCILHIVYSDSLLARTLNS